LIGSAPLRFAVLPYLDGVLPPNFEFSLMACALGVIEDYLAFSSTACSPCPIRVSYNNGYHVPHCPSSVRIDWG
jgi:hypothetical protein